jgi:hypothetical protein
MLAALERGMMRYVAWSAVGATIAVLLGRWCALYQLGDPEALFACSVGALLGLVAYQGPIPPSILARSNGALSMSSAARLSDPER